VAQSLRRGVEVVVVGRFVDDSYEQDGQRQRRIILEAELVAASLSWAIARPVKVDRHPSTATQE
jgi:single-stranded DNA-binding protein